MQDPSRRPRSRGGSNWIGIVVFLLFVFGSQIVPPIAQLLSRVTGTSISPGAVYPFLIGGAILLSIVTSVARRSSNDTPDPRSGPVLPANTTAPRSPMPQQTVASRPPQSTSAEWMRQASRQQGVGGKMPGAPKLEPVIRPLVLFFGVVGVLLIVGVVVVALVFNAIP